MHELWFSNDCGNLESRTLEYDSLEIGVDIRAFRKSVLLPASG
jgi:hypothetical protein